MKIVSVLAVILSLLSGCTSIPVEERESRRAEIDRTAEETISILSEEDADFSASFEDATGYFAGQASATTVAVIGGAHGIGVLGANWDITRRWSLLVEYNGFFGSRNSIFAAVGWRL